MLSRATRGGPTRRGSTLVELMVALVLAGVVAGAVARSRAASQAASTDALARAEARRQVRAGAGAVMATLRGVAPAGGDLLDLADSVLELRITLGASVLCTHAPPAVDAGPSATILAPAPVSDGAAGWADAPDAGDRLLVLARVPSVGGDASPATGAAGWRWHSATVAAAGVPVRMPCMSAGDALALRVPLADALPAIVAPGAAVRLQRRGRWSVYRSGRRWYLGWRDADARGTGLDVVQPVSGPHDMLSPSGTRRPTLAFGVAAGDGASLAGVRALSLRVQSPALRTDGAQAAESLAIAGALRNAPGAAP